MSSRLGRLGSGGPAIAAGVLVATFVGLAFFYAPVEATQGYRQKIFYLHVPVALVTLLAFVVGGVNAARYLWTRDPRHDRMSYVAIHHGTIWGVAALASGMIWARSSWGVWWNWGDVTLNSFLVCLLLYCSYFMLRFSIEGGEARRARFSAVFAVVATVAVPLVFYAVHVANSLYHPETFTRDGAQMPASMFGTFLVALVALSVAFWALVRYETASKGVDARVGALRRRIAALEPQSGVGR